MIEMKNAKVQSVSLRTSRANLVFWLDLDYGDSVQGFGGYGLLDSQNDNKGTAFGAAAIRAVLKIFGVNEWEKLSGRPCRVQVENARIIAVGHFLKEEWLNLEDLLTEYTV